MPLEIARKSKAPVLKMGTQFHSAYLRILRLFTWIVYSKQASLAIADQAVISISSVLLSVIVARTAGIELLGSVGFILVLSAFGGLPVAAMVSAPSMVLFGSVKENPAHYRGFLLLAAILIGGLLAPALTAVYLFYRQRSGAAVSQGEACMLTAFFAIIPVQETLRRAAFARSRAWAGLRLSVIRNVPPLIILVCAVSVAHPVGLFDIVLVIFICSLGSVIIDLVTDRVLIPGRGFSTIMLSKHWHLSRWLLLSSVFNSGYEQIFTVASGIIFGDRAVAAIRLSQQAYGIIVAGMQTFENTVPQHLALAAGEDSSYFRSIVNLFAAVVFIGVAICGVGLWWFGNDIIWFVFSIDYREYTELLLFWAFAIACSGARSVYAMAFRATLDTKPIFIADSCSFLIAAAIVIPVLHWFGVLGSGLGMLITNFVGLVIISFSIQKRTKSSNERI